MQISTNEQGIISAPRGSGNPFTFLLPIMTLVLVLMGAVTLFYFQKTIKDIQQISSQAATEKAAPVVEGCVITGCNNEICTDKLTAARMGATACVVRPEYACLNKSICRVEANGKCGWAQTKGYAACLADLQLSPHPSATLDASSTPAASPSSTPETSSAPTSETELSGDFNQDGSIDILDYQILLKSFFKHGSDLPADLNHDQQVDLTDYVLFKRIGPTFAPPQASPKTPAQQLLKKTVP
jgi:hypothetical protein